MNTMIHTRQMGTGISIEIDRPKSLGALDTDCFDRIEAALEQARSDAKVAWVAFFSRLPKGFCAGGDVRRLYEDWRHSNGSFDAASRFFETEYRVDQKIWDFPKPVIALTHGITMGGGLGLIRGASHRVVAPDSVLAMPEVSIGLYPDVGATFFLQSLPEDARNFVAFCAARFGAAQALDWGIATHCLPELSQGLGTEALLYELDQITDWEGTAADHSRISRLLNARSVRPQGPRFETPSAEVFRSRTASELWDRANGPAFEPLKLGSPLSACIIFEQLKRGPTLSRTQAFEWEYKLSMGCLRSGDFFEGVRSRLVDKDAAPRWRWDHPSKVPAEVLDSILGVNSGILEA